MATKKVSAAAAVEGAVTPAEALHFAAICDAVMRAPMHAAEEKRRAGETDGEALPHIGTLREKRLHAAIKTYLCADTACHERPVACITPAAEQAPQSKKRRMVADIYTGEEIFEVQTGGFYPLREKLAWYLANTDCRVTVVHPIAAVKYVSWINPADGAVTARNRAPKRGRVKDIARELYWLSDFIESPRFSIRILLIELEEYRMADGWGNHGKRGSTRYERFPTSLLGDVTLATPADYAAYFLPAALRESDALFTAADYARATGIRGRATYSMLRLLCALGLAEEAEEKIGRAKGYRVL